MADEIIPKEEVVVETPNEPISEPETVISSEPQTAQIPVSEPLTTQTETPSEPEVEPIVETIPEETKSVEPEIQSETISESIPEPEVKTEPKIQEIKPEIPEPVSEAVKTESKPVDQTSEVKPEPVSEPKPIPEVIPVVAVISKSKSFARELLVKARNMIQFRKRKKLDKIMTLFAKQTKITNDEVEKFLHISDATTGRYLATLVKEGKIKRNGKTGKSVFYSKI
jgi:hypothetical protein